MKYLFDNDLVLTVHSTNHLITIYNRLNDTMEYVYYNNEELFLDANVNLNIIEFEEKYQDKLFKPNYKRLDKPKVLLQTYNRRNQSMEGKRIFIHDQIEKVLVSNFEWGLNTADITVIREELIL